MKNIRVSLIKVSKLREKFCVNSHKEVIGIERSLTTTEYQTAVQSNIRIERKILIVSFIYSGEKIIQIDDLFYKVERTYDLGQYIELYLSNTTLNKENFVYG